MIPVSSGVLFALIVLPILLLVALAALWMVMRRRVRAAASDAYFAAAEEVRGVAELQREAHGADYDGVKALLSVGSWLRAKA